MKKVQEVRNFNHISREIIFRVLHGKNIPKIQLQLYEAPIIPQNCVLEIEISVAKDLFIWKYEKHLDFEYNLWYL